MADNRLPWQLGLEHRVCPQAASLRKTKSGTPYLTVISSVNLSTRCARALRGKVSPSCCLWGGLLFRHAGRVELHGRNPAHSMRGEDRHAQEGKEKQRWHIQNRKTDRQTNVSAVLSTGGGGPRTQEKPQKWKHERRVHCIRKKERMESHTCMDWWLDYITECTDFSLLEGQRSV